MTEILIVLLLFAISMVLMLNVLGSFTPILILFGLLLGIIIGAELFT